MTSLNSVIAKAYVALKLVIFGFVVIACFMGLASHVSAVTTLSSTVPEPSTLILLGFVLVALAGVVRRFRRG